jgi:microcystin-dependent protein
MAVLSTGQSFSSGDQVTAQKLNDIIGQATFTSAASTTDNSTLTLGSSKLKVKDAGITATQLATDAVITAKIQDGAVTSAKLDAAAVSVLMPTGSIMSFAGSSAPTGYLLCDGAAISRSTYSTLFGVLATTYGSGDGSSTYNIPDLRGRVIAGQDDMGGSSANRLTGLTGGVDGDVLGGSGGAETHTLATSELPAHTHGVTTGFANNSAVGVAGNVPKGSDLASPTTATYASGATSTGGGGAHNNVQPTIILNYIIKT